MHYGAGVTQVELTSSLLARTKNFVMSKLVNNVVIRTMLGPTATLLEEAAVAAAASGTSTGVTVEIAQKLVADFAAEVGCRVGVTSLVATVL